MGIHFNTERKRWVAQVQYEGLRTSRWCATRKEARDAEAEILGELKAQATAQQAEEQAPATLRVLCAAYAADLEARGKAPDSVVRARSTTAVLAIMAPPFLDAPVTALKAADLYRFRDVRTKGIPNPKPDPDTPASRWLLAPAKPSTINRDLRTLRAMLKKARPDFTFPGGAFVPEDETRVRWLQPEQEVLAFAAVPAAVRVSGQPGSRPVPFREIARLAALTLMRLQEVNRLRRDQVDLAQGVVTLPRMKGAPRHVVLNQAARALLATQMDSHASEWVFPNPETGRPYSRVHVGRVWRKAARQAGLQDFHFHDLRHHGATMALNAGFKDSVVMDLGGWKTQRMMRRYAAVTDKTLRAAAEAVAGNLPEAKRLALEAARGVDASAPCKQADNHAKVPAAR